MLRKLDDQLFADIQHKTLISILLFITITITIPTITTTIIIRSSIVDSDKLFEHAIISLLYILLTLLIQTDLCF